ncbi:hypothetical protein DRW41_15560 [Neobacillus piezotolerans]|uniref:Appr-1-p processing protein n=1 Tax=Neobacillus piezotolerans TaxID=2259171 RepID=A0A3D8GND9_9BACI|nr:hypothetical protein [Neobacillus piezotolerans]RDU36004.1 hypothetical protein DRW41_15560 [Neobacillus piezotolerans]
MLDQTFFIELQNYINDHMEIRFLEEANSSHEIFNRDEIFKRDGILESISPIEIDEFIKEKRQPVLREVLFSFIDRKGATDAEIYKKAQVDRRHFSKIRSNTDYRPGKNTVIALALALELDKKETGKLLSSAGYSLSDSDTSDLVIQFCIEKRIFDIHQVNEALVYFSLKPLGGSMV